ncbi:glycosyltransferase family 4 protein [bacterium]|nr:glycosyltransferase family 4 protein [bacterium]
MSLEKVSVLFYYPDFAPFHRARLMASQRRLKCSHLSLAPKSQVYDWPESMDESDVHYLFPEGEGPPLKKFLSVFSLFPKVLFTLKKLKPDFIFINSYWPFDTILLLWVSYFLRIKRVLMLDSHLKSSTRKRDNLKELYKKFALKYYDAYFVAGQATREYLLSLGVCDEKIFLGFDVVDNEHFEKSDSSIAVAFPVEYFLFVGRFVEKKNLFVLLNGFKTYREKTASVKPLVFVGYGPLKQVLIGAALDLGLRVYDEESKNRFDPNDYDIFFYSGKFYHELPAIYRNAVALFLISKTEEWGLVINEAMASGCPVVVSEQLGCVPDLVDFSGEETKAGLIVRSDSVEDVAKSMLLISTDSRLRKQLIQRGRDRVASFDPESFAKIVEKIVLSHSVK